MNSTRKLVMWVTATDGKEVEKLDAQALLLLHFEDYGMTYKKL